MIANYKIFEKNNKYNFYKTSKNHSSKNYLKV